MAGLLDLILGAANPVSGFADTHQNLLGAIGAGLGAGTDLNTGLAKAAQYAPQGKQLDYQQGLVSDQRNQTAQYLKAKGFDDLVPLALGGDGASALQIAFQRQQPGYGQRTLSPGETILGQDNKPVYTAPYVSPPPSGYRYAADNSTLEPIPGGNADPANPLNVNRVLTTANPDGSPLGTTGSQAIDVTAPDYSTKAVVAGVTQAAIDQGTIQYLSGGPLPAIGRGTQGQLLRTAIMNRAAEIDPSGNIAANKSQFKALSGSLLNQQKIYDTVQSSVNAADRGLQQVIGAFQGKVNLNQFPSINAGVNAFKGQVDPGTISAYKGGLQEVANEYSQVFARNGTVTDSVRAKAQSIADGDLSLPDLQKVLDEIHAQGEIVIGSKKAQIKQINDQIAALGQPPSPTGSASTPDQRTTSTGVSWRVGP